MSESYFYSNGGFYRRINIIAPEFTGNQIDFIIRFSKIYNYLEISLKNKIRKNDFDILSQSIKLFKKIIMLMDNNHYMILGSRYLTGIPWRNFGGINQECTKEFITKSDMISHYTGMARGETKKLEIALEDSTFKDLFQIKDMTGLTGSEACFISFHLMAEIIYNAGPDCDFVEEVFISDTRERPDLNLWKFARHNLIGHKIFDLSIRNNFFCGVIGGMPENKIEFQEVNFNKLSETTTKFIPKQEKQIVLDCDFAYDDYDYNMMVGRHSRGLNRRGFV
jgi:hypothetical protein